MSLKDFSIGAKLGNFQLLFNQISLGYGAYSTVFKVERSKDNQTYALKKVKLANLSEK